MYKLFCTAYRLENVLFFTFNIIPNTYTACFFYLQVTRLPLLYFTTVGNLSFAFCNVYSFLALAFYLSIVAELLIRQIIKYLYIFKWKLIVGLNDDFFATFSTLSNVLLSCILAFSDVFLGHLIR
jgi:hypothetical protein